MTDSRLARDETSRLNALKRYNMLDTPAQPEFDEIVELAAAICNTPIATVTLVDADRQWFKARTGLSVQETPRAVAFCAHAILQSEMLVVNDTLLDERFKSNPLVTGSPYLRFYAGVPLVNAAGYAMGTLAVMDQQPSALDPTQMLALKVLAQQVMNQLESARTIYRLGETIVQRDLAQAGLRQARAELETRVEQRSRQLQEMNQAYERANELYKSLWETTTDAVLISDTSGQILYANPSTAGVMGYPTEQLVGRNFTQLLPERYHAAQLQALQQFLATGERTTDWRSSEIPCRKGDGSEVTLEAAYSEMTENGERRFIGFFRDITERKRIQSEQARLMKSVERSRSRLAEAQSVAKIGSWETNLRDMSMSWSDETFRIFQVAREELLPTYHGFLALVHPDDRDVVDARFRASLGCDVDIAHEMEHRRLRPDGRVTVVQQRWKIDCDTGGRPMRAVGTAQDVTDRRAEQDRILRLSRMHEVLSGVNQLIVQASDRQELLDGCCRIAAEHGQFGAAWIDAFDRQTRRITPIARNGLDAGFVVPQARSADSDDSGNLGLAARALVQGEPVLSNDFTSDANPSASWPRALERGYRAGIALPLTENGEIVGTLSLLAKEADFFDPGEVELLNELAADISLALDRLARLDQIRYLANYDVLTGLPNRALFSERLGAVLERSLHGQEPGALVLVDLHRLHEINVAFGRQRGDDLLKRVGKRLRDYLGDKSPLGRIAGDHFAFVLTGLSGIPDLAHAVPEALDACFAEPFNLGDHPLRVSASAGVAVFPQDGSEAETLLKHAERAMNAAKADGQRLLFYSPDMNARVAAALLLESRLRNALQNNEFVLHYQPKFDHASGQMTGVEALIRWNDPQHGLVPPLEFIPLLEESGLILDVGKWVLHAAIADYRRWRGLVPNPPRIAVNVSSLQLRQGDFVQVLRDELRGAGSQDHGLDLEITESVLMTHVEGNIAKLDEIRQMGIRVAIDDFGTGYSSLLYLAKLPLDSIKVDRSFIVRMSSQKSDLAIVSTIVSLAHQLGLNVVAEGVDATEQADLLAKMRCDEVQGFLFSKPLPAQAIDRILRRSGGRVTLHSGERFSIN